MPVRHGGGAGAGPVAADPRPGPFGDLLSGGWTPPLNLLAGVKMTLGCWAMVQRRLRDCGLL
ncbi:MAG: hypothetical protein VKI83_11575 [Synechococcaceae cyanobacterium]|nr:hypothetical protein [Synechococcaceae cyanobacterium]